MPEHIDLIYHVTSDLYGIATFLIAAVCLNRLCGEYLGKKRSAWLIGGTYFLVILALYYMPAVIGNLTAYSLALAAAFAVFAVLDRGNIRIKIFLIATFFSLRWIAYSLVGRLELLVSDIVMDMICQKAGIGNPDLWKYYYAEFVISILLQLLLCYLILNYFVRMINRVFFYKQEEPGWRELAFLLIPSVSGMVVYGLFRVYADAYERETGLSIFQEHSSLNLLWALCYLLILAGIVSTLNLYQAIRRKQEEENAKRLLESRLRDMQSHISEVERLYADVRGIKHDIRNHMEVIHSLLEQGKMAEAREYSGELSKAAEVFRFSVKTGNPVTDVIVHEKAEQACAHGVGFTAEFHYPADMGINAFDVSVILSNALDNAIEAAKPGGFVKISSFRNKKAYLITVENSFVGKLELGEDGLPQTRKGDRGAHGFGLQNIRAAAKKYSGDMWIGQKGETVVLTVMLLGHS